MATFEPRGSNPISSLLKIGEAGGQGLAFGIGYGTGVRLGYEDVYPLVKDNAKNITRMLGLNFVESGLRSGSGTISLNPLGAGR